MENSKETPRRPSDKELEEQGYVKKPYGWRKRTRHGVIVWYNEPAPKKKKLGKRDKLVPKLYVTT